MAISQHQFYLDRKQIKAKITAARSLGDIATDLTENGSSKVSRLNAGIKNQHVTASNGSLVSTGSADSEMNDDQKKEKLSELRKKEKEIQGALNEKMAELKKICLREAELTGKLPKEYPMSVGEKPPGFRKRIGTAFKLDELFPYNEDPYLRNLESRFALQQKIVEAAKKLAAEPDISKTVKKKRRRNCLDAVHRLQEIEDEMNRYRVKKGKKPTQRASLIIAGGGRDDMAPSDCSSLCESLPLDDGEYVSVQFSEVFSPSSINTITVTTSLLITRQTHTHTREMCWMGLTDTVSSREVASATNSPYKTVPRRQAEVPGVTNTPVMTRNAFSSNQLGYPHRSPACIHGFRHRSGSLESQAQLLCYPGSERAIFPAFPSRRSNSSDVLDDCSSYTSLCSSDIFTPCSSTPPYRTHDRRHHCKVEIYGNAGSMPNLVPSSYTYHPHPHYSSTAYYVTGYPALDYEPYTNGTYVYENELEGHYNVNPSYQVHGYHGHNRSGHYGMDGTDSLSQNPYATVRPARTRQGPRGEVVARSMQKALMVEHLRGWYNRTTGYRDYGARTLHCSYDYDRGSQHSLGYQTLPTPMSSSTRTNSYSSVSSVTSTGPNWPSPSAVGRGENDMDTPLTPQSVGPGAYSLIHSR
uniref:Cytohesin Ubiquitin Protein Inducing domain-containing protein n=1 Tax=Electrophorus electricus TaxID=8005 RepID=A0A4W4DSN6_ELEEL